MADEEYFVEAIIDKSQDGRMYKVKWVGYEKPTWEPVENYVSRESSPFLPLVAN